MTAASLRGRKAPRRTNTIPLSPVTGITFDNSRFALATKRLLPLTNEAVRLSVMHKREFRPTCEVKTRTFDPRTTLCQPWIFRFLLKNILCNNFCCCRHLPAFSIGYTALSILHIQGLLYVTPCVFKFYSGKYQVQDCSYLVTYIVCRKNIVFGEKKEKNYFFVFYAYIRRTTKYANLSDAHLVWPRFYAPF